MLKYKYQNKGSVLRLKKFLLAACATLLVLCTACTSSKTISAAPNEVAEKLTHSIKFSDQLTKLNDKAAARLYGLDMDKLGSQAVYVGTAGATPEEVAVWKAKDDSYVKTIEKAAKDRISNQKESFKDYVPKEMPKLENAVVKTSGKTVILCVSGNSEKANSVIKSFEK